MTRAEREHLSLVKSLECMECRDLGVSQTTPTVVHHVREGTEYKKHGKVVALCNAHHLQLHSERKKWRGRERKWLLELNFS